MNHLSSFVYPARAKKLDDGGMNTPRSTPSVRRARPQPFHRSTHTAIAQNTDIDSGQRTRSVFVSKLELAWQSGSLLISCTVARSVVNEDESPARGRRWAQGLW